jgi:hypothetical protein
MRVIAMCIVALGLITSPAIAGTNDSGDKGTGPADSPSATAATTAQPASASAPAATTASSAKPEESSMEGELQQLRELLEAQAKQLQEQQQRMQLLEEELNSSSAAKENPTAAPASAETPAIGPTVAMPTAAVSAVPNQDKAPATPNSINIKGISLTPGGFMAAETVWHQKAIGSDINTSFNANIFPGNNGAHISEFFGSARQSRISMLVEGNLDHVKIGGYYETDFLSAGTTSNNNQSNSYTLRQRQFWGQAAFNTGWTVTGGQQWSLLTETTSGMNNRSEALPQVIDAQYVVGFSWARQYGVRFTKSINNKIWLGFSVENPQATLTVHGNPTATSGGTVVCTTPACTGTGVATINPTTLNNFLVGSFGTSGGLYNPLGNYGFDPAPDLVFKAAFEPGFGHYEVFGVLSNFHDRVFPCVVNSATLAACGASATSAAGATDVARTGGGIGVNARVSVLQKKVDAGIHVFGGNGIGRYGSAGLPDATARPDGTLALIRNYQALGTLQFHPTPKLDINLYVGGEYEGRSAYVKSTGLGSNTTTGNEGYGGLGLSNSGCWTETLPISAPSTSTNTGVPTGVGGSNGFIPDALGSCTGDTRNILEGSMQIWYRFYRGPKGTVQLGGQYSNDIKNTWRGVGGAAGSISASGQPHSDQNMVFTSFRYVLP